MELYRTKIKFQNDLVKYDAVLISISTTGQGDLPVNARSFWKRLRNGKLKGDVFSRVCFTSFGIGDSSYPKCVPQSPQTTLSDRASFNWASRKVSNRLLQLGARCFCERGESDEQHSDGIDGLFSPWSANLRGKLLEEFPLPHGASVIPDEVLLKPEYKLEVFKPHTNGVKRDHALPAIDGEAQRPLQVSEDSAKLSATLLSNNRLTPESHWQDVRLFEFALPHIDYSPGDVLTIHPHNSTEDVDEIIRIMDWTECADQHVHFVPETSQPTSSPPPLSLTSPLTLRTLITQHLDLVAIPRRSFFSNIAHFTSDTYQRDRLLEFTNPAFIDELYDYTTRPRRSILEVLQEFDTVKIPWQWAASILPHIRARQFSIASGGSLKQGPGGETRVQLLVAIVKYKTVIKKLRQGLCTRYLEELPLGQRLDVGISTSGMKVYPEKPALMIGPGTGVAPLRAMMHERALTPPNSSRPDSQMLFYGGRNRTADFFFEDEWMHFVHTQSLQVHTAFSRDQNSKVYVQDRIRENGAAVYEVLQNGGIVYVCGSSGKMPQAVRAALVDVVEKEAGVGRDEAEGYLVGLEKAGRYQQETW